MGRPRSDDRLTLNLGCAQARLARSSGALRPMVDRVQRFLDWRDDATFEQVLERLRICLNQKG